MAELLVVVAIAAILCGLALPPFTRGYDRLQARAAAREVMAAFFSARSGAIALARRTSVVFDNVAGRAFVVSFGDTLMMRPIGVEHGVTMTATRDSMAFFPDGLGLGAANLSVILSRGAAAETVLVSREGRVKLGARAR